MRKLYFLPVFNLILAGCVTVEKKQSFFYTFNEKKEISYIYVVPYSFNLFSIDNIRKNRNIGIVKKYIEWYFQHLNYPDKYGITGSIYDYIIYPDGREENTYNFDSIDSYSATFLILLEEYYKKTKDEFLIEKNKEKIDDIAYTIVYLQDKDGLTFPCPDIKIKYLMDNCESYAGLKSYLNLSEKLSWKMNPIYIDSKEKIKKGVLEKFYDEKNKNFYWAISEEGKHKSNWSIFYPDAYAQLFPVFSSIIQENNNLKEELWKNFLKNHGEKLKNLSPEQKIIIRLTKEKL